MSTKIIRAYCQKKIGKGYCKNKQIRLSNYCLKHSLEFLKKYDIEHYHKLFKNKIKA